MSDLSDFAENLVATWLLTDAAVTRPASRHVALFTSPPSDAGGGTEVSGFGYARQAYGGTAAGSDAANAGEISFSASGGGWGTIAAVGIFDAASGGNLLVWKVLAPTVNVGDGEALVYSAGALIGRAA